MLNRTKIQNLMTTHHVTHKALAEALGVSRSYMTMILKDEREISRELAEEIAAFFNVPLYDLIQRAEAAPNYQLYVNGDFSTRHGKALLQQLEKRFLAKESEGCS